MSYLVLENVSFSIEENHILKNINLSIEKGQFFSILGPSGTGKTTCLRIITGALDADGGKVILDNEVINNIPMEKRKIVKVHQSKQLFPHMTVLENIQFGMKVNKLSNDYINKKTSDLLEFFNMKSHIKKYPNELSGGQQQLVALMRALAIEPKLLLLDEPFTGLDYSLKLYIRDFILKVHKEFSTTIVMITHDKEDAFFMSEKIAFMFNGEIVLCEETKKLSQKTNIESVDKFLGEIIVLNGGRIVFSDKIINL